MSRSLSTLVAAFFVLSAAPLLPAQSTVVVAAASDLTDLEPALAGSFGRIYPGWQVKWVTAASGVLAQQIENGAPYDVFLSANAAFLDRLSSNGKVAPDTAVAYARGRLGVLWRDGKSHPLRDLRAGWVRFVALPNPQLAPYGAAAVAALKHQGLWDAVRPKVVYGENVRQTLQLFESKNADAVVTSASLLGAQHPDVIPAEWHPPIVQKAGVVSASRHGRDARNFVQFLLSPDGQAVFAHFGFASAR